MFFISSCFGKDGEQSELLTFFCVSGGTAIGGRDARQTVRPVEGAGTRGERGAGVGWG